MAELTMLLFVLHHGRRASTPVCTSDVSNRNTCSKRYKYIDYIYTVYSIYTHYKIGIQQQRLQDHDYEHPPKNNKAYG